MSVPACGQGDLSSVASLSFFTNFSHKIDHTLFLQIDQEQNLDLDEKEIDMIMAEKKKLV